MAEAIYALYMLVAVFAVLGVGAFIEQRSRSRRSPDWLKEGGMRR